MHPDDSKTVEIERADHGCAVVGQQQPAEQAGVELAERLDGYTHPEAEFTVWTNCVAGAGAFVHTALELTTEN